MRTITKVVLSIALIFFALPMGALIAFTEYRAHESTVFCQETRKLDTKEVIAERARTNGLSYMEWDEPDKVWIFRPEVGPFFRFACEIEFKFGQVAQTSVVDAD